MKAPDIQSSLRATRCIATSASNHAGRIAKGKRLRAGISRQATRCSSTRCPTISSARIEATFWFSRLTGSGIEIGLPPGVQSQHYIKRLAGLPGDVLRINAPYLFVNGREGSEWVFERVMSGRNGYRGSSNMQQFPYLSTPEETFKVPEQSYFALGDNSYFSKDSRDFGAVPELNVTGKGLFVYWPFSKRWGLIH
ncbi:MAG: signal peptidase I [Terrimicrobiaceae bacterium]